MPTPVFPSTLPGVKQLKYKPADSLLADDAEGDPQQFRLRSREICAVTSVSWQFLETDFAVFREFWKTELLNGHRWFTMNMPSEGGDVVRAVRFVGRYKHQHNGYRSYEVSGRLEVRSAYAESNGAPTISTLLLLHFDVDPLVEATQLWQEDGGAGATPAYVVNSPVHSGAGALVARDPTWPTGSYYLAFEPTTLNVAELNIPSLQFTLEFFVTRQGFVVGSGVNWEVGIDMQFADNQGVFYDSIAMLSVSNTVGVGPRIHVVMDGTNYQLLANPSIVFTLQPSGFTHVAATFDNGRVKVFNHGTLVYDQAGFFAVDEVDTAQPFPSNGLFARYYNQTQFFGDPTPVYMDEARVSRGLRYTANFTPPTVALT